MISELRSEGADNARIRPLDGAHLAATMPSERVGNPTAASDLAAVPLLESVIEALKMLSKDELAVVAKAADERLGLCLTPKQYAKRYGHSLRTVRYWIAKKLLPVKQIGGKGRKVLIWREAF